MMPFKPLKYGLEAFVGDLAAPMYHLADFEARAPMESSQ
jgi:hypothetical protein